MEKVRNGVDTEEIVARAQKLSAIFDMVTNGVPVQVEAITP